MSTGAFEAVRASTARVVQEARAVRIDDERLDALATELAGESFAPNDADPAQHRVGDDASTLAFVVTLDAINFGSGYFPFLAKEPGRSGYLTIAQRVERRFRTAGPWSPTQLEQLGSADCAALLGQDLAVPEVAELMGLYAAAWNELGRFLNERHAGRFEPLVEAAAGSADAFVRDLLRMPFYRDVADYAGFEVMFLKRAQISVADLCNAFAGDGLGRFADIDDLTMFADNLVPHVLRCRGVLVYADDLARRIDAGIRLAAGAAEEVEIRAAGLQAVERCVARLRAKGVDVAARQVDAVLWSRGQRPEIKARPRHRTRSVYY